MTGSTVKADQSCTPKARSGCDRSRSNSCSDTLRCRTIVKNSGGPNPRPPCSDIVTDRASLCVQRSWWPVWRMLRTFASLGAEPPNRSPAGYRVSPTRSPVCGARSMTTDRGEIPGPEHLSLSWHHRVLLEVPRRTLKTWSSCSPLSTRLRTLRSVSFGVRHVTRSACEYSCHRCIGWPALVGVAGETHATRRPRHGSCSSAHQHGVPGSTLRSDAAGGVRSALLSRPRWPDSH